MIRFRRWCYRFLGVVSPSEFYLFALTWNAETPDECENDDPVCLNCLVRPARPGSVYCGRLCRVLGRLRGFGVLAV